MPYKTMDDLPERVRDHLPQHAQEIFRVAWTAVKDHYEKGEDGDWQAKK